MSKTGARVLLTPKVLMGVLAFALSSWLSWASYALVKHGEAIATLEANSITKEQYAQIREDIAAIRASGEILADFVKATKKTD